MTSLKLTKVGRSTGTIIPKEMLAAIETKERYLITLYDAAIAEQLDAGREFTKEYRETFEALAK